MSTSFGIGRIFEFELAEDKKSVEVTECCDYYFTKTLTKDQFGEVIAELQKLHDQMVVE